MSGIILTSNCCRLGLTGDPQAGSIIQMEFNLTCSRRQNVRFVTGNKSFDCCSVSWLASLEFHAAVFITQLSASPAPDKHCQLCHVIGLTLGCIFPMVLTITSAPLNYTRTSVSVFLSLHYSSSWYGQTALNEQKRSCSRFTKIC